MRGLGSEARKLAQRVLSGGAEKLVVAGVASCALGLRLAHIASLRDDVLFEHPPLDEEVYVEQGRRLARGLSWAPGPFWQPPGTGLALSLCFRAFGSSLLWPRLLQAALGSVLCILIWILGRRLISSVVGLLAAAVTAVYGALIFSTGELLPPVWAATLALGALVALLDAPRKPALAAAAGGLLGVCALFTPTIAAFTIFAALVLWRKAARRSSVLLFAATALAPLLWTAAHNYSRSGELVLISTNGGVNFYIGNNPNYLDTLRIRPGPAWSELVQLPWREARVSEPARQSAWFVEQGAAFWWHQPGRALLLFIRKFALFFHAVELPRDTDIYAVRDESPVLRALVGPPASGLPGLLIMPLAVIGIVWATRARGRLALPLAFVLSQAAAYALFFPSARYRVPCLPVLVLFATAAAAKLWSAPWATRRWLLLSAAAVAAICMLPVQEARLGAAGERDLYRGLAKLRLGDADAAIAAFERAAGAAPDDSRPAIELGKALKDRGRLLEAAHVWEAVAARDPSNLDPARWAADTRELAGDRAGAISVLRRSIDARQHPPAAYARDHLQLARLQLQQGEPAAALDALRAAVVRNPVYVRTHSRELLRQRRTHGSPEFWSQFDALLR